MVSHHQQARAQKVERSERDEGPCRGKVLEVNAMAEDGEENMEEWKGICEVEHSM